MWLLVVSLFLISFGISTIAIADDSKDAMVGIFIWLAGILVLVISV